MSRTLLATLACVVAAACWAANAVIAAGAFELGVTPERLAQTRVIVALVPLAAYLLIARRDLMRPPRAATPALRSSAKRMRARLRCHLDGHTHAWLALAGEIGPRGPCLSVE